MCIYIYTRFWKGVPLWMCGRLYGPGDGTNIHEQNAVCSSPVARLRQNLHKFGIWKAIQADGNDDENSTHLNTHFKQTGEATMKMERPQSVVVRCIKALNVCRTNMLDPELGAKMPAEIAELLSGISTKKPCTYHIANVKNVCSLLWPLIIYLARVANQNMVIKTQHCGLRIIHNI